ncbi:uncharacterized protein LOC118438783 [Folsomia candida]|uniref:Uncharacterized protein n=1 Tax=Folsomia candida TaxID=158441 RepID=A0A226DB51_FOLCA|nr:uncharacterized protein LOC118438783 [Folsomia candida]OXA42393.1 hypothetical protein Fcan01_22716 [Folsomia candida]
MTVTPLMWRALDNFAKLFKYMPKFPLDWDIPSQTLVSYKNSKNLFFWKLLMFSLFGANSLYIILLLGQVFGSVQLTFVQLLISILFLGLGLFIKLLEILMFSFTDNVSQSINSLVILEKQIHFKKLLTNGQKLDIIGLVLNGMIGSFASYTFIVPTSSAYMQFDAYSLTQIHLVPLAFRNVSIYIITPLKVTLFINCWIIIRTLSLTVCVATLSALMITSCISSLNNKARIIAISGRAKISKYFLEYDSCQIILHMAADFTTQAAALFLFYAFLFCIIYNFVALKMYRIIPMPLFLFFPAVALLTLHLVKLLLPIMIGVSEESNELRNKWRRCLVSCHDKRDDKQKNFHQGFMKLLKQQFRL